MDTRSIAAVALASLTGCADLSGLGGTSEFACKAPVGVRCDSLSGSYYNSLTGATPSASRTVDISGVRSSGLGRKSPNIASTMPPPAYAPSSLRAPGREMRLWIKAWEDEERDLVDQSYVYLVVDEGHWRLPHVQEMVRNAFPQLTSVKTGPDTELPPESLTPEPPQRPDAADSPPINTSETTIK